MLQFRTKATRVQICAQRRGVAQGRQLASDKERKDVRSDVDKGRRGLLVAW